MPRTREDRDVLTLNLLNFLIQKPEELASFLSTCGIAPADLRQEIQKPEFQAGMLDYFLEQENLLNEFLGVNQLSAQEFMDIRLSLPGADKDFKNRDFIIT